LNQNLLLVDAVIAAAIAIAVLVLTPGVAVAGMVGLAALALLAATAAGQRRRGRVGSRPRGRRRPR
jgi:hypothetical protein